MKIVYLFIVFLSISNIYAQSMTYGIKFGLPISDIQMTDMPNNHINVDKPDIWKHDFDTRFGINVSAFIEYNISLSFSLLFEPGYILKGAKFTESESILDLHYINLPILFSYKFSDGINIYIGPEFSNLLLAELDFDGTKINMDNFYNKNIETSIILGAEYEATNVFRLGLRYSSGLTKVSETVWRDEQGNLDSICKENNYYILFYLSINIIKI